MPAVLDFVRSEDERLKDVPDSELAEFLASEEPDSLRDPEFAAFYYSSKPSTRTEVLAPGTPRQAQLPPSPLSGMLGTTQEQIAAVTPEATKPDTQSLQALMSSRDALIAATPDPVARERLRGQFNAALAQEGVTVLEDKPIVEAITTPMVTLPTIEPLAPETSTALKVGAGAANAVMRLTEFFTSPLGIATFGLGALPRTAQQAVAGAFAFDMARHTPEIVRQFEAAHERGDTQAKAEFAVSGALNTLFAVKAGEKALGIERRQRLAQAENPAEAIGFELLGYMNDPRVRRTLDQMTTTPPAEARPLEPTRTPETAVETPVEATAKAQAEVSEVASVEGKRSAKEIKDELVSRIQGELDKVATESGIRIEQRGEEDYQLFQEDKWLANVAIEKTDSGFRVYQHGKDTFAAKSLEEAFRRVKENNAIAEGKVSIEIPGDGTFTVYRSGPELSALLRRANRIDTRAEVPPGKVGPRAKAGTFNDQIDATVTDALNVYGSAERAITALRSQLNRAQELELPKQQQDVLKAALNRLGEKPAPKAPLQERPSSQLPRAVDVLAQDIYGKPFDELSAPQQYAIKAGLESGDFPRREQPGEPAGRERYPAGKPAGEGAQPTIKAGQVPPEATVPARAISAEQSVAIANRIATRVTELQAERNRLSTQLSQWGPRTETHRSLLAQARYLDGRIDSLLRVYENFKETPATAAGEVFGAIATPGPALTPSASPIPSLPPKSQRQIITDLAKGLKLPIRFGRLRTSKFAGYFLRVQNLIAAKRANDIPIVSHEVGHKLDSVFGFASDPTLATELDALGDPSLPGSRSSWTPSKTIKYKLNEGVAEFVRHWLIDPPEAARLAPNMLRRFEAALDANKDFGDTMRLAQSDIQTWRNATPQARLRSHISVGTNPNKTPYTLSQLTRDLVDDLHFLKLPVEQAKKTTAVSASQDPYVLGRNLRGSYGMANSFVTVGVADFASKRVQLGTSLEDALKPVAGRIADFRDWIVAKRAQELHSQGRTTGLVNSDVAATAARFDSEPAFQEAFRRIKAWNDALLQYAVDSGLVTQEAAAAMRAMNQDYVPLHRIFEVGAGEPSAVEGGGIGRGLNVGKPGSLRALKGSPRDIVDPLETMVRNAYALITASEKSAINRAIADLSKLPDMGEWVEHIATPKDRITVGLEKLREQLEDAGADLSAVPPELMLQFFQNSKFAPFGENVIKIVREGKPEFYRLKRELFETFNALDLEDSSVLIRILSEPAQVLRSGVVLAPDFALANALRDAFTSAIVSRHGLFPFEAVVRGVGAMLRNPQLVAEWQAAGGKNSIEANYFDRAKLQKFLAERITKDLNLAERAWIATKSPLQALRWLTSFAEEATRIGEYQKAFNDLIKTGMPEGDARRLAAYESRDRQDFAKGGAKTKIPRRLAAFWNAGIQGNVRLFQALKEKPIQTTLRGIAFITIPKLVEQSLNWDDEDYWDRPQWERDLFFLIPAGTKDGHTRFIRIPTPFEAGIIFGTLPGRILQTIREKNAEAAKTFPGLLTKHTFPNPTPQLALALFENFMIGKNGWDVYRQRPIVPGSLQDMPVEMQWTQQTSLTAKTLGKALGFSPMKIDHLIRGTTGGLGQQITHQILDRALSAAGAGERTALGKAPGARFVTTPARVSSESIDRFYKTKEQLETELQRAKAGGEVKSELAWHSAFQQLSRQMSEARSAARQTDDPAAKAELEEFILQVARITVEEYQAFLKTKP